MSGSDKQELGKILAVSQAVMNKQPRDFRITQLQCYLSRKLHLPMVIQIYSPKESMIRRHAM